MPHQLKTLFDASVHSYLDHPGSFKATVAQLSKDLALTGCSHEFKAKDWPALHRECYGLIKEMDGDNPEQMASFIYRVDLSKEMVRKRVSNTTDIPFLSVLSAMLIERELSKVIMRRMYRP